MKSWLPILSLSLIAAAASDRPSAVEVVIRDRGEVIFFHNDREFPAGQIKTAATNDADRPLFAAVQVGDELGFRVEEGSNVLEQVTGRVDAETNIWFSNAAEFSAAGLRVLDVLRELSFIDNILHTPQTDHGE